VEDMVFKKGEGRRLPQPQGFNKQKLWTACNFRFRLDGFEQACRRVSKVESFTVKQKIIEYHMGGSRSPLKTPSQIDFPQISFYVPEADAEPFMKHFTKRAVKGEVPGRLNGMIQTLDNQDSNLFTLTFKGADIVSIVPDKSEAQSEEIKQVKIDIYIESMEFEYIAMQVE
ncbi:MAG: phage tail protein, partial [Kofleriaceae bacterium]